MNPRDTAIEALERANEDLRHVHMTDRVGSAFRNIDTALTALRSEVHEEPVAMIHNDYDVSVKCSRCVDDGGFGCYDDLELAKYCPGCGGPISEQVDAKGVRTPHPLYQPPTP